MTRSRLTLLTAAALLVAACSTGGPSSAAYAAGMKSIVQIGS